MTTTKLTMAWALAMAAPAIASAQSEPAPAASPYSATAAQAAPAVAESAPAPAAPAAVPAEPAPAAPVEPAPAPAVIVTSTVETVAEPAPPTVVVVEEEEEASWTDNLETSMFVDTYYNFDWNMPKDMAANGSQGHRAYVRTNGFALSFLGFEAAYTEDLFSVVASLRFGPSASKLIGYADDGLGIDFVKQAYISITPTDTLTLDIGQFDTIYGAEVADSWANINYTRGALYFLMQPFWHQGARLGIQASDTVGFTFMAVNGVNEPFDGDRAMDVGAQIAVTPNDMFSAYLGYYGALFKPEGMGWSHFADLVLNLDVDPVLIVFNGDLGVADFDGDTTTYYGLSLAARFALAEQWGLGVRGEYLAESDATEGGDAFTAFAGEYLATATLTLEYLASDNLILRLDNRLEASGVDMFYGKSAPTSTPNTGTYFSTVLGVVAKTN